MQFESLSVLYEDERLLAVDKPSGLPVHHSPELGLYRGPTCVDLLEAQRGEKVFPIHRLDRPTSGVLLFARSREAAQYFGEVMRRQRMRKVYAVLSRGFTDDEGAIVKERPLRNGEMRTTSTHFKTHQRLHLPWQDRTHPTSRYALLSVEIQSGIRHQIRRDLASVGHPIIGDTRYGSGSHNVAFREHLGMTRLFLQAIQVEISEYLTTGPLVIQVPRDACFDLVVAKSVSC